MKRGKCDDDDDEKVVVGPMFPRLHVNDTTEKGGPRAPPRNKMALYEHFNVPFQRFNNNSNSSSNSHPLASSSTLGNDPERSYIVPVSLPSQTATQRAESYTSHQSNDANMDTLSAQLEQRKKVDGDGSHAYDHSRIGQSNNKTMKNFNGKKHTPVGARNFCCSVAGKNDGDKDQTQFGSLLVKMRKDVNNSRLHQGNACVQQESNDSEHGDGLIDSVMDIDNRNSLVLRSCSHSTADQTSVLEATNDTEYHDTNIDSPMQKGNSEGSNDLSKTSTLESLSSMELSPDGVVQILGQKLFWKARRKITTQQRVFAVQVFELHRLIKVQQLIAGSSDLLFEDAAILGKFPLQASTPKSLSLEVIVEPPTQNHKQQDHSEKLNHKWEHSAENGVGKTSFSSQKYGSHLSNYTPFYGNPHQENIVSQSFNQSPGYQWLIPVMTPSEGLVYKPYPGLGFTGPMYGGCGPFGPGPPNGAFMNPAYGIPDFHQAVAVSPFIPPGSYAHFPPHCVPAMNLSASGSVVEQANRFAAHVSHDSNGNSSLVGASFNTHNQSSCNLSNQKNGATLNDTKFQPSIEREVQGIPTSRPNEKEIRIEKSAEGRDALSPSLTVPSVSEEVFQSLETKQKPQVIRVVPHNPRSASVSAARIFQSIQEERKQYDLV